MRGQQFRRVIRVVIASPSDVNAERKAVRGVVKELNPTVARYKGITIDLCGWETDTHPGFHPQGPQGLVDDFLKIDDCDVLVGIFWKRFGAPAADAASGTEHEFQIAYETWKKNLRPQIMMYFNERHYSGRTKEESDQRGDGAGI
jgi:hypothetical protein